MTVEGGIGLAAVEINAVKVGRYLVVGQTLTPGFERPVTTQQRERAETAQDFVAWTIKPTRHLHHMLVVAHHFALGLQPYAYRQLKDLAGSKLTKDGVLVITARTHRTREANRDEARRRLTALLTKAHHRDAKRRKTKPSRAAKARRVEGKKKRSAVKQKRGRVTLD